MKPRAIALLAGLSLTIPATFAIFGAPTLLTPLPALVVIPLFVIGFPAIFVPSLFLFAWHPGLLKGSAKFPKRTYVLFLLLVALSVAWFVFSWKWGIQFQGRKYAVTISAINATWIVGLGAALWRSSRTSASFYSNLVVHWFLFAWLAWCAFPYLGELP
jgi:hypothetical protein